MGGLGVPSLIVLDTHTWIWWIGDPGRLSEPARHRIENEVREGQVCVSSISCWELTLLVKKGRLELTVDPGEWIARSESLSFLRFVPVDNRIAVLSNDYPAVESLW
ncbi:PIN domain-containing protein [bacterium]|nr:MAG: PIN domain-containing protein [bacterium]